MKIFIRPLIIVIDFFSLLGSGKKKPYRAGSARLRKTSETREERILNENMSWLEERWMFARKERDAGEFKVIPHWFFDESTDRQRQKIEELGLNLNRGRPTKGELSDIIGLFEPIEEGDEKVLKFFKVPLQGMNQSKSRYQVAKLFAEQKNIEAWKSRPASPMQKEFYRFFNLKTPQGLTHEETSRFINEY